MDESLVTCRIYNFKADENKKDLQKAEGGKIKTMNYTKE